MSRSQCIWVSVQMEWKVYGQTKHVSFYPESSSYIWPLSRMIWWPNVQDCMFSVTVSRHHDKARARFSTSQVRQSPGLGPSTSLNKSWCVFLFSEVSVVEPSESHLRIYSPCCAARYNMWINTTNKITYIGSPDLMCLQAVCITDSQASFKALSMR